jgi:hypothetical protein
MDRALVGLATGIINQQKTDTMFVSQIYNHTKLTMRKLPFIVDKSNLSIVSFVWL